MADLINAYFFLYISHTNMRKNRTEKTKFDFSRLWILLAAFLLVTILASEAFAKKSNKDVESKSSHEKRKNVDVEYRTK